MHALPLLVLFALLPGALADHAGCHPTTSSPEVDTCHGAIESDTILY